MRHGSVLAAALAVMAVSMVGCTAQDQVTGVPRAVDAPSNSPKPTATDALSQELRFVACMRQQGIADMPDPVPGDASGHSAVRYALDVMGKGTDQTFQAALDKCMSLLPPPDPAPSAQQQDSQKTLAFAKCMREHGLADFPDPGPDGLNVWITSPGPSGSNLISGAIRGAGTDGSSAVIDLGDPTAKAAYDACKPILS